LSVPRPAILQGGASRSVEGLCRAGGAYILVNDPVV